VFEEATMISNACCIASETSEDRFDETVSPEESIRIARSVVREGQAGEAGLH
jgi:hypothetical protein